MNISYLISVIWLIVLVAAVVDCVNSNIQNKVGWVALIVLLPLLGAFIYFRFSRGRVVSEL